LFGAANSCPSFANARDEVSGAAKKFVINLVNAAREAGLHALNQESAITVCHSAFAARRHV